MDILELSKLKIPIMSEYRNLAAACYAWLLQISPDLLGNHYGH